METGTSNVCCQLHLRYTWRNYQYIHTQIFTFFRWFCVSIFIIKTRSRYTYIDLQCIQTLTCIPFHTYVVIAFPALLDLSYGENYNFSALWQR